MDDHTEGAGTVLRKCTDHQLAVMPPVLHYSVGRTVKSCGLWCREGGLLACRGSGSLQHMTTEHKNGDTSRSYTQRGHELAINQNWPPRQLLLASLWQNAPPPTLHAGRLISTSHQKQQLPATSTRIVLVVCSMAAGG